MLCNFPWDLTDPKKDDFGNVGNKSFRGSGPKTQVDTL